jgi:hypothetical protein
MKTNLNHPTTSRQPEAHHRATSDPEFQFHGRLILLLLKPELTV